jgi:hypothetical protein
MRRGEFVFCIGFEGSTAIVDGRLMRRHSSASTRQLAEAGLFKQAVCSAVWNESAAELDEVLALFNKGIPTPLGSVEELKKTFGVAAVPEGVKKVTIV